MRRHTALLLLLLVSVLAASITACTPAPEGANFWIQVQREWESGVLDLAHKKAVQIPGICTRRALPVFSKPMQMRVGAGEDRGPACQRSIHGLKKSLKQKRLPVEV